MGQVERRKVTITNGFVPRPGQLRVANSMGRFTVLLCHRRWGKTVLAINLLIRGASSCPLPNPRFHYFAPLRKQAKDVAWDVLKTYTRPFGWQANESELRVDAPGGARIQLGGADDPDSHRGIYSDGSVFDEPAQMNPGMLSEVLRPALADRQGWLLAIGTPKGRHGLFYELWNIAENEPGWARHLYKASQTRVLPASELRAARRLMTQAEYNQEFECDWGAAIKGAYWGEAMNEAEASGRITDVIHDQTNLVHLSADLGISDAFAVWFYQFRGGFRRYIDYEEYTNHSIPDIVKELRAKPYQYGGFVLPHDAYQRSLETGNTRAEVIERLGFRVVPAPKHSVDDGIDTARNALKNCYFDKNKCKHGIECLRQYRSEWDSLKQVLRLKPVHDWASHGADSFRYSAITDAEDIVGSWGATSDEDIDNPLWQS